MNTTLTGDLRRMGSESSEVRAILNSGGRQAPIVDIYVSALMDEWQLFWDSSDNGRCTYRFFNSVRMAFSPFQWGANRLKSPKKRTRVVTLDRPTTYILTAHLHPCALCAT